MTQTSGGPCPEGALKNYSNKWGSSPCPWGRILISLSSRAHLTAIPLSSHFRHVTQVRWCKISSINRRSSRRLPREFQLRAMHAHVEYSHIHSQIFTCHIFRCSFVRFRLAPFSKVFRCRSCRLAHKSSLTGASIKLYTNTSVHLLINLQLCRLLNIWTNTQSGTLEFLFIYIRMYTNAPSTNAAIDPHARAFLPVVSAPHPINIRWI
jgi:hypothetical protein